MQTLDNTENDNVVYKNVSMSLLTVEKYKLAAINTHWQTHSGLSTHMQQHMGGQLFSISDANYYRQQLKYPILKNKMWIH